MDPRILFLSGYCKISQICLILSRFQDEAKTRRSFWGWQGATKEHTRSGL